MREAKFLVEITWRGFYGNSNGLSIVYSVKPLDPRYKLVPDRFYSLKELRKRYELKRLKKNGTYSEWRKLGNPLKKPIYLAEINEKFLVKV